MPSHPLWQTGFVLLFIQWIETSPWLLVKGTGANTSSRVLSPLRSHAIKHIAGSSCERGRGKRNSVYVWWLPFPTGLFLPGQKISSQHIAEVWTSWSLREHVHLLVTWVIMSPSVCPSWWEEQDAECPILRGTTQTVVTAASTLTVVNFLCHLFDHILKANLPG